MPPCYTTRRQSCLRSGNASMNILLLGSGGREHALAWKIAASPLAERLYCAPGNAGIAGECEVVALDPVDHAGVIAFCRSRKIDLVVVGPEAPMATGIVGGLAAAGTEVVVEEFLAGEEASFFALCDGETAIPLAWAQDHKRAFDGDQGPNTGGMGAYSPMPAMTPEMSRRAMDEFVLPTVRAMKAMGAPYKGVLYAGLMITPGGPRL